jgi:hypothetical protein
MSIEAMKQALEALEAINEMSKPPINIPLAAEIDGAMEVLRTAIREAALDALAQTSQEIEWDTSDMAHRPGGLSVEQEKLCKYCGGIGRVVCDGRCMPEQEPVAWMTNSEQDVTAEFLFSHVQTPMHKIPLYEAPSKREWVGLTDEESEDIYNAHHNTYGECITSAYDLVLDIEAKLKERNT